MRTKGRNQFRRRGAAVATVAITGTVLIGFAALAIDMGVLYNTRIEAQRSADAGALAGAWKLLGDERVRGTAGMTMLVGEARQSASQFAGLNRVFKQSPTVDLNAVNSASGDIVVGRLEHPADPSEQLATNVDPARLNSISVLVRRDDVRNGPIPFFFGQIFGLRTKNISGKAVASAQDSIAGYRVTEKSGNAKLLPFALHRDAYLQMLAGDQPSGDHYRYDHPNKLVGQGPDGIYELNVYPGGGSTESSSGQLPPGNFGTLDIGGANNTTADISRQIREGVNAADLAHFGGELRFDADGKILLNGDTGLSAAVKDDLASIVGQPRTIPLFTTVSGPGDNATFTIVAFAGIRVLAVDLTGSMSSKSVIIQPAVVVDDSAIIEDGAPGSYFVYYPPSLVR